MDPDAEFVLLGLGRGGPVETTFGGFFRLVGRDVFLAFRYSPQALHIVAPWGDLLHKGVRVVPQLLHRNQSVTLGPGEAGLATTDLQTCPPWLALALTLPSPTVEAGLGPLEEPAPSFIKLSFEFGDALPSLPPGTRLSLGTDVPVDPWAPDSVASRGLADMGRDGSAVRIEAGSR